MIPLLIGSLLLGCGKKDGSGNGDPHLQAALDNLAAASTPELRFLVLGDAAKRCFAAGRVEDARKHAAELATLLPTFRQHPGYGQALHDLNLALGRIAVHDGRLADAKRHLLESVRVPGPRQMDFGPDMSLAKDLLEKGERQVVLEYLGLCKRFWNYSRLDEWSQQIREGQTPDFGSHLLR